MAAGDWRALFPIMSDPIVMAHWDSAEIEDPEVVEQVVAAQVDEMASGHARHWTIEREGKVVGACDLSELDWKHRRGEVGFLLAKNAWGQGVGFEAMSAVVDHAAYLGLRRLLARAHAGNDRSERLLERLGFQPEGYLRGHIQRAGERRDCRIYGLLL